MPENGDNTFPVKTTLSKQQYDFIDRIKRSGKALNDADAIRYIVNQAMEKGIIELEG